MLCRSYAVYHCFHTVKSFFRYTITDNVPLQQITFPAKKLRNSYVTLQKSPCTIVLLRSCTEQTDNEDISRYIIVSPVTP